MLNQNPRQTDFVLGTCPDCQKVVRIPVTAVTSQSKSQVRCPICDSSFEIADILEETIPSVEVIDEIRTSKDSSETGSSNKSESKPERINAIDTPDLFHVSKDDYRPSTEKKNGRFVVPELLSKGIKKKKSKRGRRRTRSHDDPKLRESLEKLKRNTSATSLNSVQESESEPKSSSRSSRDSAGKDRSSKKGSSRNRSEKSRSRETVRTVKSHGLLARLVRVRSISDLKRVFQSSIAGMNSKVSKGEISKHESKLEYIMIGIGALLAIPILHLMMWWFAGVDPLGLAKPTSVVMPFVVPADLRAETDISEESESAIGQTKTLESDINRKYQSASDVKMIDGKLPKPKIDPDSVHSDDY